MPESHWTLSDLPDLHGRTMVITGASSGIGLETARALADAGARVVLAVRNTAKAAPLAAAISAGTEVRELDVADLASVRAFAAGWQGPLDVLINNAGIMAGPERRTSEGFELQFATNHLGPFLLTTLLLPAITDRVVTVSSQLHARAKLDLGDPNWTEHRYNPQTAYANSKLANILFTTELQRRLTAAHSAVIAVNAHPGIARTNLSKQAGGVAAVIDRVAGRLFNDAERGALPTLFAATQDLVGGAYVGPGGLGHLRGYPEVHAPAARSQDPELARQLWDLSARLTGAPELVVSAAG
jgi:NAD(P)-dependent dehydrogenase (short-subunit alcohol dehydrogenase family)